MNRNTIVFVLLVFFLLSCDSDSPYIPESYKLLPQSDILVYQFLWHDSSIPISPGKTIASKAKILWYNPWSQVGINDIWPTIELSPDVAHSIHVLDVYFKNFPESIQPENCWGGVMTYLPEEFRTQFSSFQYLELTIKGDVGIIHFDIGEISEDIIPNGILDSEDIPNNGIRNGILDPGEDTGLDRVTGTDDYWDINRNGVKDPGEPFSEDDYEKYEPGSFGYPNVNGTEGNGKLDTEDLNDNGTLDLLDNYREYTIHLDKSSSDTSKLTATLPTDKSKGWYCYVISLDQPDSIIGNPNPVKPEFCRIWFEGLQRSTDIIIAAIDFK
jgi:hypothetical protein